MGILAWQKEKQNSQCKTQNAQEYLSCKCLALLIYYDDKWGCISKNTYWKKLKHGYKKQRILILACLQTHHRKFWFNLLEFQKYLMQYFKKFLIQFFIYLPPFLSLLSTFAIKLTDLFLPLTSWGNMWIFSKRKSSYFFSKQWLLLQ